MDSTTDRIPLRASFVGLKGLRWHTERYDIGATAIICTDGDYRQRIMISDAMLDQAVDPNHLITSAILALEASARRGRLEWAKQFYGSKH